MFFLISPRGCCCHSRSEGKDGRRRRGSPRGTAPPHRPPAFACTSCGVRPRRGVALVIVDCLRRHPAARDHNKLFKNIWLDCPAAPFI